MAEPPPGKPPSSLTAKKVEGLCSLDTMVIPPLKGGDVSDMAREEERSASREFLPSFSDPDLHSLSEIEAMKQSFLARMAEEIDTDAEYQKEMEEHRIADRKNGHFVHETNPNLLPNHRNRLKNRPKSSTTPEPMEESNASRPSARVSAKVATYEARLSSKGTKLNMAVGEKEKGENTVGLTR